MTEIFPDNVRQMLSQFAFEIDTNSKDGDLTCIICKKLMVDAYQSYCECQFCHDCVLEYLLDKEINCPGNKAECSEEKLKMDVNISRNSVLNKRILRLKVYCPNKSCMTLLELEKMDVHLLECGEPSFVSFSSIESINSETLTHSQSLINLIRNLRDEIKEHREQLKVLNQDAIKKDETIESQRLEAAKQKKAIESLERKSLTKKSADNMLKSMNEDKPHISKLVETVEKIKKELHSNVISFTVDGFTEKKSGTDEIIGPYFYSHLNGYKLQLRIFPGGIRKRKGTHMSMFFVLCKGEYDNILPWPCKYTINIGVVNQMNNKTHRGRTYDYSTILDDHKFLFHKPVDKNNEVCGCSDFISHKDLTTITGLINDNTVIIQCVVSAPS